MKIDELIKVLENKILYLQQQRLILAKQGEVERILLLDAEVDEIIIIIDKLKS